MKFSIIVPSYNQGKYLKENLTSLINQNEEIEIIIIDGGSTDTSVEVIRQFENNIRYWQSKKDNGTYDALNIGLQHCTGDYIGVVNSDDILLDGALTKLKQFIINNECPDWVTGGIYVLNENSKVKAEIIPTLPKPIGGYSFLNGCWIYHPCTFIKKEIYQKTGVFAPVNVVDLDYWLRMEKAGYKPVIFKEYIAGLRFHSDCKSFNYVNLSEEIRNTLIKFAITNSLNSLESFKRKIKELDIELVKYKTYNARLEKKVFNSLNLLINFTTAHPDSIKEKWFWGLLQRCIFGFKKNEFNPVKYLED
ncbi:glycosyltransferase [Labilibacter marinus]|uniref:glycosyltransferase n=1 Tax=Labilibacter marinus TaxID=1477105 RepID=UPI00095030C4|nr:glycosyltransferase [Labilibacter marinus]